MVPNTLDWPHKQLQTGLAVKPYMKRKHHLIGNLKYKKERWLPNKVKFSLNCNNTQMLGAATPL